LADSWQIPAAGAYRGHPLCASMESWS